MTGALRADIPFEHVNRSPKEQKALYRVLDCHATHQKFINGARLVAGPFPPKVHCCFSAGGHLDTNLIRVVPYLGALHNVNAVGDEEEECAAQNRPARSHPDFFALLKREADEAIYLPIKTTEFR